MEKVETKEELFERLIYSPGRTPDLRDILNAAFEAGARSRDKEIEQAYIRGRKYGITLYAWWKDGIQYVGNCGSTLEKALKEIE